MSRQVDDGIGLIRQINSTLEDTPWIPPLTIQGLLEHVFHTGVPRPLIELTLNIGRVEDHIGVLP